MDTAKLELEVRTDDKATDEVNLDEILESLEKRIAPCLCSGNCQGTV